MEIHLMSLNKGKVTLLMVFALLAFLSCSNYRQIKSEKIGLDTLKKIEAPLKKEIPKLDSINSLENKVESEVFNPDTAINDKLILRNEESIYNLLEENNLKFLDREREFPIAYIFNKGLSEYLAVYHYPGDLKKQFSVFEIGYLDKNTSGKPSVKTNESTFKTESGIGLGMSLEDLLSLKGKNYREINVKNDTLIKYVLDNYSNSTFLKRHKLPSYFLECKIQNATVENIKFGFDYP